MFDLFAINKSRSNDAEMSPVQCQATTRADADEDTFTILK